MSRDYHQRAQYCMDRSANQIERIGRQRASEEDHLLHFLKTKDGPSESPRDRCNRMQSRKNWYKRLYGDLSPTSICVSRLVY